MSALHLCLLGDAGSIHLRRWASAMVERGLRVSVLATVDAAIEGAHIVRVAPAGSRLGWFARIPAVRAVLRALAPDIVHAHYVTSYGLWGAAGGRQPLVLTAWGSDILVTPHESALARALTGWTLRRAALITADSRDVLGQIRSYRPRAPLHEVFWGADTDRFRPHDPARDGPREDGFHVASLRAWEPNYRIDVLLRAFARLAHERPAAGAVLHLCGGGSRRHALHELTDSLGIASSVRWHGVLAPDALARRLAACDVSVSVPASDATSVSVLESMACGLPVIASELPANRQWIEPDGGWLVPVDDADALAAALLRCADDPGRRRAQGRANRARVEEHGATRTQMDRMAALYRGLVAGAPPVATPALPPGPTP